MAAIITIAIVHSCLLDLLLQLMGVALELGEVERSAVAECTALGSFIGEVLAALIVRRGRRVPSTTTAPSATHAAGCHAHPMGRKDLTHVATSRPRATSRLMDQWITAGRSMGTCARWTSGPRSLDSTHGARGRSRPTSPALR